MPPVDLYFDVPPQRVFDVLSEPGAYTYWVVGSRTVERRDARWPEPGSVFHHTQGKWPMVLDDETEVAESDPPHRLVLLAKARPMLVAKVILELRPHGSGTRVTMEELPCSGLLAPILRLRPSRALTRLRNKESLRRLRKLARGEKATPRAPVEAVPA